MVSAWFENCSAYLQLVEFESDADPYFSLFERTFSMDENAKAELQRYVSDMIATQSHVLQAVTKQADDAEVNKHPQALRVINSIKSTFEKQLEELRSYLKSIDGSESVIKNAVGSVAGFLAGVYDQVRAQAGVVSRHLRDDYTALSLTAIAYTMLNATANLLGDTRLAGMAQSHLKKVTPLIIEISQAMPHVVCKELAHDHDWIAPNPSAAQTSARQTQEAWQPHQTGQAQSTGSPGGSGTATV